MSPKVSKPEIVCEVELNGKASANPRVELRASVRCRKLASRVKLPSHVGPKTNWLPRTKLR